MKSHRAWGLPLLMSVGSLLVIAVGAIACGVKSPPSINRSEAVSSLGRLLQEQGVEVPDDSLISSEMISLHLLRGKALRVRVTYKVPSEDAVSIAFGGELGLTLVNGELTPQALPMIIQLLNSSSIERAGCGPALANDLARLVVDPREEYGVIIDTREEVPTTYELSDRLRDLRRAGATSEEVQEQLLKNIPTELPPSEYAWREEACTFTFLTWDFFGGDLVRWVGRTGTSPKLDSQVVASKVGSWKRRY